MSELKKFLTVLQRMGYPTSSTQAIANAVGYNLDYFLEEMINEFGLKKTREFISDGLKIFISENDTVKVDLSEIAFGPSYAIFEVIPNEHIQDDTVDGIYVRANVIDSSYYDGSDGIIKNFDEMYEDVGLGEMGEWEEFMDSVRQELSLMARDYLGYYFYFE